MPIKYDNRVAVVTGAGGGLGRSYALMLAARGAKVVVNDLGIGLKGEESSANSGKRPADVVVDEIRQLGGEAVANYDSVEFGDRIIQTAIKHYGRVDILINNAGILRDVTFQKMKENDWDMIMLVHLKGAYSCTKAAWKYMQEQQYGRIINTSSAAGLYGNGGQTNYSVAKIGLVGFTKTLAAEGERKNIIVNCIAPLAGTRMTATVMPKDVVEALKPDYVAPLVGYLVSEACKDSGQVFEVGAGWVAKVRWQRSAGNFFTTPFTPDDVEREWSKLDDFSKPAYPTSLQDSMMMVTQQLENKAAPSGGQTSSKSAATAAGGRKSAKIFQLMEGFLNAKPDMGKQLVAKVNSIFQFEIGNPKDESSMMHWTIDLKSDNGSVKSGKVGKGEAVFRITDDNFVDVCLGKLDPTKAFMQGKMKIKGNISAATKFTPNLFPTITKEMLDMEVSEALDNYLKGLGPSSGNKGGRGGGGRGGGGSAAFSSAAATLKSAPLLDMMARHLQTNEGQQLVKKVGFIYQFDIIPSEGSPPCSFTVDLRNGQGSVKEGSAPKSDAQFAMLDDVFVDISLGRLNAEAGVMQGKIKFKGNLAAASKFSPDMFPKAAHL